MYTEILLEVWLHMQNHSPMLVIKCAAFCLWQGLEVVVMKTRKTIMSIDIVHAMKKLVKEHQFTHVPLSAWVSAVNHLEWHVQAKICVSKIESLDAEPFQLSRLE